MFLYGKPRKSLEDDDEDQDVFEMVARHNGPLPDYHPQMLLQCLLWGDTFSVHHLQLKRF
jgi:hypothetical protein